MMNHLVSPQHKRLISGPARLDDFEERIMFGDLGELIRELEDDMDIGDELVRGLHSLRYFRDFYHLRRTGMDRDERGRVAAYDAAWCLELIELAQRERGGRHYRA